jgi:hypothetical protein
MMPLKMPLLNFQLNQIVFNSQLSQGSKRLKNKDFIFRRERRFKAYGSISCRTNFERNSVPIV